VDERVRTFLVVAGCGGFLGLLGALFGAITGALYWRSGKASGTAWGLRVADAFARAAQRQLEPGVRGALVGAVDGFLFLGLVGTAAGAVLASLGLVRAEVLGPLAVGALLLTAAAVAFGTLAYGFARAGVWAVPAVFAGGVTGAVVGAWLSGWAGLLFGCVAGGALGNGAVLLAGASAPRDVGPDDPPDDFPDEE
jgi:hypothetical protein